MLAFDERCGPGLFGALGVLVDGARLAGGAGSFFVGVAVRGVLLGVALGVVRGLVPGAPGVTTGAEFTGVVVVTAGVVLVGVVIVTVGVEVVVVFEPPLLMRCERLGAEFARASVIG